MNSPDFSEYNSDTQRAKNIINDYFVSDPFLFACFNEVYHTDCNLLWLYKHKYNPNIFPLILDLIEQFNQCPQIPLLKRRLTVFFVEQRKNRRSSGIYNEHLTYEEKELYRWRDYCFARKLFREEYNKLLENYDII